MVENSKEEALKILENLGYEHFKKRDFIKSLIYYQRYLEIKPDDAEINNTVGYVYQKIGGKYQNLEKQIEYFEKALELRPDYIQALRNLAVTYPLVGKYQKAVECFEKLFEVGPVIDDYVTYAYLKIRLGDFEKGWKYYEYRFVKEYMATKYPEINKPRWEKQNIQDKTLLVQYEQGFGDTIMFCRYIERIKPLAGKIILRVQDELVDLIKTSFAKKIVLTGKELGEFENINDLRKAAINYYKKNLQGTFIEYSQLGKIEITSLGIKKTKNTSADLRKLQVFPKLPELIKNAKYEGTLKSYKLNGKFINYHYLTNNVYINNNIFEHRITIGEDIKGKKYYNINDINYYSPFQEKNSSAVTNKQILGTDELTYIISDSNNNFNPEVDMNNIEVVGMSTPLEDLEFDYHVPLVSLLHVLNETKENIPLAEGYIKADEEKIQKYKKEFFDNDCLKIGIAWNGTQFGNIRRDIPLKTFYPLTKLKNVKVYAFQKNYGSEQLQDLAPDVEIVDLGKTFHDFSDTAAAMANLDLFVTSDNALFNLSGAMGKKTFVLLNKFSEWRWFLDKKATPWYSSARIFKKQDEFESWDLPFAKLIEEI